MSTLLHVVITFYLYMYPLPIVDPLMFPPLDQPSKEVDEKANAYFQAIYNGRMAVDHLLEILKQFKDSQTKKEKVIVLRTCYHGNEEPLYCGQCYFWMLESVLNCTVY